MSDQQQAIAVVSQAIDNMQHDLDVRKVDISLDKEEWHKLETQLVELLLRAYYRNHNKSVD